VSLFAPAALVRITTHPDDRLLIHAKAPPATLTRPARPSPGLVGQLAVADAFAATVVRYLALVLPAAGRELARWRSCANAIPNSSLRETARTALAKRGNVEGAALFAIFAARPHRHDAVRALVAFQAAYNYLDALSERDSEEPYANARQLHAALAAALQPRAAHLDYYAFNPEREDGGFLLSMLDCCRQATRRLPSYPAVEPVVALAAERIVDFQALNRTEPQGGDDALRRWATQATEAASGLRWWETAAAAGSSLSVHALLAAAASPNFDRAGAVAIDGAYFPTVSALHSLLDSLVDRAEDRAIAQPSMLGYYRSPAHAASSLRVLSLRALTATEQLTRTRVHRVVLTAMCSYYLSAPSAHDTEGELVADELADTLGLPLRVAIAMFAVKRRLHALTDPSYG
jgi:tetraprenyl-beta-curcumene synthase